MQHYMHRPRLKPWFDKHLERSLFFSPRSLFEHPKLPYYHIHNWKLRLWVRTSFTMKPRTASLLFLALRATLLLCGSVSAEEPVAVEVVSEQTPKTPVKSAGCSLENSKLSAIPGGPSKRLKLGDRYLRLSLPKNYDPKVPAPLIVAYHDFNNTALEFEESTMLSHEAYNKDAIVVYPEAIQDVSSPLPFTGGAVTSEYHTAQVMK